MQILDNKLRMVTIFLTHGVVDVDPDRRADRYPFKIDITKSAGGIDNHTIG